MNPKVLFTSIGVTFVIVTSLTGFYMNQSLQQGITVAQAQTVPIIARNDNIIGSMRPDFTLTDVAEQQRNISEWDGKVLAINFWATWCPPCIKEIPEFIELQHKYQKQGLQFIGIALQRAEEVTEFITEYGMNYPVLAGEMEVIEIAESYGNAIGALPYTVIIDRTGHIHYVKQGALAIDIAEAIILELL
ncbi:MAG: peroxiredoxin [Gammaproteobacteria bacterium]|jgi:peroxiredoxin